MRDEDLARIAAYLAGEGTSADRAATEQWIQAEDSRRAAVATLREAWARAGRPDPVLDTDKAWDQLQRKQTARSVLPAAQMQDQSMPRRTLDLETASSHRRRKLVLAQAAAILVVAALSGMIGRFVLRSAPPRVVTPAMREVATARGQRAMMTLGDGSRVVLGVESTLRFAEGFGGSRRDVYLNGDALFDVAHDAKRPFVVHTSRATTTDIGTTFVVRDYANDGPLSVAVRAGKVSMSARSPAADSLSPGQVLLSAGESARLSSDGAIATRHGGVDDYFAWTEGRLAFKNTPLSEVAATLERWYDVEVHVARAVAHRTVNATFDDDGVSTVLSLVAKATDAHVTRHGKIFNLEPVSR